MKLMKITFCLFSFTGLLLFLAACNATKPTLTAQPMPGKTVDQRVDSLLALMTLDEKIGQMTLFTSDWDVTGPTMRKGYEADIKAGRAGAIFNAHTSAYTHKLQRMAVEETRLGIPLLLGYDVIHGYRTIFPISLGESASWDMAAIEKGARVAAVESTAAGLHWTFAPMVDIARDPRWGRMSEGAGEDVYLGKLIAAARVRGFQGSDLGAANTLLACVKHFAAYGAAQAGRDYHTVDISDGVLRETYLPPFKAALDAGAQSVMTSFNELNGIPATGNRYLMTQILRDEWGFDGFVVTDYTSINEMIPHGVVADEKEAGELALQAGVDMDMQGAVFYNHLKKSVAEGRVQVAQIDEAVRRVLRVKYELGLFDDPYRYGNAERERDEIMSAGHLAAARDVARKSFVLLKNEGQTLPLNKTAKVAVIGQLADSKADMLGSWHADGRAEDCVTVLAGIRAKVGAGQVTYAEGTQVEGMSRDGFTAALNVARNADAIVAVVGENWWMSGEAAVRSELDLPGNQLELVRELIATGKPVAVVLMNGRPLAIPELDTTAAAILETWFPGTQGGHAVADVLFGDYNPSGKLPVTFPRSVGQVPIHYNMKNTGRPLDLNNKYTSKYLDIPNSPLYPFGHGLSYTTFTYGQPTVDRTDFSDTEPVTVSVKVTNTGKYAGSETVQLYVHDLVGSVTRPVRELKGFEQVMLQPGESRTVTFTLNTTDLVFYTADLEFQTEPGDFDVYVGGNSDAPNKVRIRLRDDR